MSATLIRRIVDDVERSVMRDGSAARFREKLVTRGIAAVIGGLGVAIGVTGVAAGIAVGASGEPLGGLLLAAMGTALGSALGVLGVSGGVARTVVTQRAIHLQAGPRFVEIPLEGVVRTEVGRRTSLYREHHDFSVLPLGSASLTVVYREGGAQKRVIVSTRHPEALLSAIEGGAGVRVRIAEQESTSRDDDDALAAPDDADAPDDTDAREQR